MVQNGHGPFTALSLPLPKDAGRLLLCPLMKISVATFAVGVSALLAALPVSANFQYGLPWAAPNEWAPTMSAKTISWYHHWQMGKVPTMKSDVEYVPTYWGPSKYSEWQQRKNEIDAGGVQHILAFNEPDIDSQANMSPGEAVSEFMKELQPYAEKGIKVSSPQMVYNLAWLRQFMHKCQAAGCTISFIALHWYGGPGDLHLFQKWVTQVHNEFNLPIWVSEFGLTKSSHPSDDQVNHFMEEVITWMSQQDFIVRAAWNGCYDINTPPDGYATPRNAFFSDNGNFRDTAGTWLAGVGNSDLLVANNHHKKGHHGKHSKRNMEKRRPSTFA